MKIIGARFVKMPDGKKILQLQQELWGGEGWDWVTPETVEFDSLKIREQDELQEALGLPDQPTEP